MSGARARARKVPIAEMSNNHGNAIAGGDKVFERTERLEASPRSMSLQQAKLDKGVVG